MNSMNKQLTQYNRYLETIILGKLKRNTFRHGIADLLDNWEQLDVYEKARFLERFDRIHALLRTNLSRDEMKRTILAGQNHGLKAPMFKGREVTRDFKLISYKESTPD